MKLLIEQEDAQKVLDYIMTRPAKEVIAFIPIFQNLKATEVPSTVDMAEALEEA